MKKKIEFWCYGGQSKAFFKEQNEMIHQYNTKMIDRLLLIMTIIIGIYLVLSAVTDFLSDYFVVYLVFFVLLLAMLCISRLKTAKTILFTKLSILLLSLVMFCFVCILGTVLEPDARATMFVVYLLVSPMLFINPTHYTYGFLLAVTCVFFGMSLGIKDFGYARMDVAHGITCLVLGIFISHHILESRMTLYALNARLDTRNLQLDGELAEKEQQLLQGRISILLSQIQPHFLYNTLTVICGLCDENPKEAKKVTAEFADYLRHNLDSLNQNIPISFSDELQHTQIYLSIEKKRFEEKLQVIYNIGISDFSIPSLTVQPLVENAVKHGIFKRKTGGTVAISTRELGGYYEITISDDGIGFDQDNLQIAEKTRIGTQNVRERLRVMCGGTLTIESEVGCGATAIIKIPKGGGK